MLGMWFNKPNIMEDSNTFLRIISDEIHMLTSMILVNLSFFLHFSSPFSLALVFPTSKLTKFSIDPYLTPKNDLINKVVKRLKYPLNSWNWTFH